MGDSEQSLRQRQGRLCVRYSGDVYDVTDFADKHPGGRDWLRKYSGEDVTEVMQRATPHRHSSGAYSILARYRVSRGGGELEGILRQENHAESDYKKASFYSVKDDKLIDWSRPLLAQVPGLGENYIRWVHEPVDFGLRLFQSDLLETLSKSYWYLVPLYWVPITLLLLHRSWAALGSEVEPVMWSLSVTDVRVTQAWLPVLVLLGVLLWTFCEYALHRWLFHMKPPSNITPLVVLHFVLHGQHHKSPMDRSRLVFPIIPASVLGGLILLSYSLFSPWPVAQALFAGTALGYMGYDLTHYYIHHGSPTSSYFSSLKRYHVKHHFQHQQLGFGISSRLWDYPFGTLIPDSD